ncbi:phosphonoacetaldehyde dehydrogenase, partial [Sinorhizobium medicae]
MTKPEVSIAVRHEPMRIAGQLIDTDDRIEVRYPWNNTVVGTVPAGRAEHARAAAYQPKLTRYERQKILLTAAETLASRKEEISDVITLELGISKTDSLYEVGRAFDVFTLAGQMCIHDDGEIFSCDLTPHGKARKIFTTREPLTAISAITPFNHPLNMVAHKVAPAIATNNCVVVKPTELTPITALLLADILYEAGLPPEMLSVVTGWPADIGMEMITNPYIDLVTFTGSVPVGKLIAANAHYKRQVLELGGNDPLIILNDLSDDDLARAADLAVAGATKNSGQRCTAVKRILCQESVADRFVPMVLERAKRLRFGDPMDRSTDLGTVIHEKAAALFEERVLSAAGEGADILYHPGRSGALLPPIVVDRVPHHSDLVLEETFGPIIPIVRVPDDDEATIALSNSTAFGLSSGVCTNDYR